MEGIDPHARTVGDADVRDTRVLTPAHNPLRGRVRVPGDKSISHRALILGGLAEGVSTHTGVLDSADVRSTADALRLLGASVEVDDDPDRAGGLRVRVKGWGESGPTPVHDAIDCGNSGTTARLLMGAVAGWDVEVTLTGDASLSKRPMRRVLDPLEAMGAATRSTGDTLPVSVRGGDLAPIEYRSPVASAQVKTALLLAGLRADGRTTVIEPGPSRDHTERMLPAFGVPVRRDGDRFSASVHGPAVPSPADVRVPGDPSSAAFLIVAALITPGSAITVRGVSLNPTRTAFLEVLARMGADIEVRPGGEWAGEPVGDITAGYSSLTGTTTGGEEIPRLIDEVPVLAVAAAFAHGVTRFEDVAELRVKESDRLAAAEEALVALGGRARSTQDGLEVTGEGGLRGGVSLDSRGDHRLAMAFHVAALACSEPVTVTGYEAVSVSYPTFPDTLAELGATEDRRSTGDRGSEGSR